MRLTGNGFAILNTITMTYPASVNTAVVQQWVTDKLNIEKVKEQLAALGYDEEAVSLHLKEYKKLRYGKRQPSRRA